MTLTELLCLCPGRQAMHNFNLRHRPLLLYILSSQLQDGLQLQGHNEVLHMHTSGTCLSCVSARGGGPCNNCLPGAAFATFCKENSSSKDITKCCRCYAQVAHASAGTV